MSWRGVRGQTEAHYFTAMSGKHSVCRRYSLGQVFGHALESAPQCEYCQKLVAVEITATPIKAPRLAWGEITAFGRDDSVDALAAMHHTASRADNDTDAEFAQAMRPFRGALSRPPLGAPEPVRVSEIVTKLREAAAELTAKSKESAEIGPAALAAARAERNATKKELAVWRTQARKADKEVERLRLVLAQIATTAAMPTARVVELALDALNQTYAPIEATRHEPT